MNMRRGLGAGWALVTVAIAGIVAWFAYHAGLATTIASSGAAPAVREGVYYGGYPEWGFGFGFFPLLLFILLIVFLFRRRRWYGGHWGGRGYWGDHGRYGGPGSGEPGKGPQGLPPVIDEKLRAWHEQAHGNAPSSEGSNPPQPPADTPSGTSGPV